MKRSDLEAVCRLEERVRKDGERLAKVNNMAFSVFVEGGMPINDKGLLSTIQDDVRTYLLRSIDGCEAQLRSLGVELS